jgi:hypothetical protein
MKTDNSKPLGKWGDFIPWFITIACSITLLGIAYFLVKNIEWFKSIVSDQNLNMKSNPEFMTYVFHLHLSMIKRSIGLFAGFSIMFLGLGISFYTIKNQIQSDIKMTSVSANLSTTSPGIFAILIGGFLIAFSIYSKDTFPDSTFVNTYSKISSQLVSPNLDSLKKVTKNN